MKIAAHRGNQLNAPENSIISLISAYTSGVDVLEFDVQLTNDYELVVSHDGTINRLCALDGPPVRIYDKKLEELRWGVYDFSKYFNPNNQTNFQYYRTSKRAQIEILSSLLDQLPNDIEKLIELKHDSTDTEEKRIAVVQLFSREIEHRGMKNNVVVYSKDKLALRQLRELLPGIRVAVFDWELSPDKQMNLLLDEEADGIVTDLDSVFSNGMMTTFGQKLEEAFKTRQLRLGAILYPYRKPGVFRPIEYRALKDKDFIWSISTDTSLQTKLDDEYIDLGGIVNPNYIWFQDLENSTDKQGNSWDYKNKAGKVDRDWYAYGYAKFNSYCKVSKQGHGIRIELEPYKGFLPKPPNSDEIKRRLDSLELRLLYVERSWPFYSGGGFGIVRPLIGDFCATVEYECDKPLKQAQTLEMAVTNVDPAKHRDGVPRSFRDADSFYDPHGCPPYVGVEHDEDDGYRINWNLGSDYDNNQYGPSVGNGKVPLGGVLRLERKGSWFSAYYRNNFDAPEWICVGVVCNQSMNNSVYLRCVAKRWLQEREGTLDDYYPVEENVITFKNLHIVKPVPNKFNLI